MIDITSIDLKSVQTDSVDFCRGETKTFRAKQYDKQSRFIRIYCTDNGKQVVLNTDDVIPYLKIIAPGNRNIYERENLMILDDGSVLIELTPSALNRGGKAIAELNIVGDGQVLSTMSFNIIIESSVYSDDAIMADHEYSALKNIIAEEQTRVATLISTTALAEEATKKANDMADYAKAQGDYANDRGTYADAQGDYALEQGNDAKEATEKAYIAIKALNDKEEELQGKVNDAANSADSASKSAYSASLSATFASESASSASNSATSASDSATAAASSATKAQAALDTLYSYENITLANAVKMEYLPSEEALAISFV